MKWPSLQIESREVVTGECSMMSLNVAVASDMRFLPGAIGTLASIRLTLEEHICLHVVFLHNGLSMEMQNSVCTSISKIKGNTKIDFKKIDLDCSAFPKFYNHSVMTYARFCLPELCSFSKVIYIDTDFLVCKSLYSLMSCKTSSLGVAAVQDWLLTSISKDLKPDTPFPVDGSKPYFNAGLLVLNLNIIRSNKIFQKAKEILNKYPNYCSSHDQSALNYVLNGDFERLDESFNKQNIRSNLPPSDAIQILADRSANIHFITQKNKPWVVYSRYPAETMFRILLDYIYPNWKSQSFESHQKKIRRRFLLAMLFPIFFKVKGLIKTLLGKNSIKEVKASMDWQIISDDLKFLDLRATELSNLYDAWKRQIESRII